jgi:TnpA family transposase
MRLSAATLLPPMILHSANGIGVSTTALASPCTDYGPLTPLIGGAADLRLVEENWDEVLRLAASLRAGTVPPSVMLKKIGAFPRQNALNKALREIGHEDRALDLHGRLAAGS